MEFGKLSNIDDLTFSLPADRPETIRLLRGCEPLKDTLPHIYIGCTGWAMKEWVGLVYPKGCKTSEYLYHYAKQFNTIEMNTTHYRIPTAKDIEKWYKDSTDDFRFAPKMLQTVSHSKNLGYGTGLTTQFCEAIQGLGEKLGVCFMQMPPAFQYNDLAIFEKYLARFPKNIPLAIEVRHADWFSNEKHFTILFDMLEHYKVSTVLTDVAGRRDVLHQRLTTSRAIIRFVGNGLHPTDYKRVDDWVACLKKWLEWGLQEVYFFSHQPDNILSPQIAQYFHDKIKESYAVILRGPKFLTEKKEIKQISLF
ncbi:MAG: DUF72 domain-containing protein [Saprospiraceae bacterium]|nr:DUF72 domain-containing protein [Saprospiraceae bacterium]